MASTLENDLNARRADQCRACDNIKGNKQIQTGIYECRACNAVFGQCYLGDSYSLVLPQFSAAEIAPDDQRYFDFTTIGSKGIARRHGWYDPQTRLITQVG
jgi:hypothetical protein